MVDAMLQDVSNFEQEVDVRMRMANSNAGKRGKELERKAVEISPMLFR